MTAVYLGADVQTTGMGWAAVTADHGRVIRCGWLPYDRGRRIESETGTAVERIADDMADAGLDVVAVAVERVGGGRGVQSMLKVADAQGIASGLLGAAFPNRPLWRPTPGDWKALNGLPGNCGKDDVRQRVRDIIADGRSWVTVHDDGMRQDTADAVCIAWADREACVRAVGTVGL